MCDLHVEVFVTGIKTFNWQKYPLLIYRGFKWWRYGNPKWAKGIKNLLV